MDNLVSIGLLFAVSLGAVAQVSSNGPVVKDYGEAGDCRRSHRSQTGQGSSP